MHRKDSDREDRVDGPDGRRRRVSAARTHEQVSSARLSPAVPGRQRSPDTSARKRAHGKPGPGQQVGLQSE
jgi:hypothetical protein